MQVFIGGTFAVNTSKLLRIMYKFVCIIFFLFLSLSVCVRRIAMIAQSIVFTVFPVININY